MVLERDATITEKGQTTVPKPVREALGVRNGDRIRFRVDGQGGVSIHAVDEQEDPVLDSFLTFLARDIATRPQAVSAFSPTLLHRLTELTEGMDIDLEAEIEGDAAL